MTDATIRTWREIALGFLTSYATAYAGLAIMGGQMTLTVRQGETS